MPTTLADLVTAIRVRSNTTNSQVVTDDEIKVLVNQNLLELYDLVVRMHPDHYVTYADTTVGSDGNVPIDSVVYKLRGVDVWESNTWRPLKRFMFNERYLPQDDYMYRELGTTVMNPGGPVIQIQPVERSPNLQIRVWFVPRPVEAVSDSDSLDSILDSHREFIIAGAAAAIYELQEDMEPAAALRNRRADLENKLRASIPRDVGANERIQDTRALRYPVYAGGRLV